MRGVLSLISGGRLRAGRRRLNAACHPRDREFGEVLNEVRRLGLAGKYFTPDQFADNLAERLGITIKLIYPDEREASLYRALRARYGFAAGLHYFPDRKLALIEIPSSFEGVARLMLAFHELSHLAAGHPIAKHRILHDARGSETLSKADEEPFKLPVQLARREAPAPELCELDADLRARDILRCAIYGHKVYDRDEHFLALKEHWFPRPKIVPTVLRNLFS